MVKINTLENNLGVCAHKSDMGMEDQNEDEF